MKRHQSWRNRCERMGQGLILALPFLLCGTLISGCVLDRTGMSQTAAVDREVRRTQERVALLEGNVSAELMTTTRQLSDVRVDSEQNQVNLANSEALLQEVLVQTQSIRGTLETLQRRVGELESDQERIQEHLDFQLGELDRRLAGLEDWSVTAKKDIESAQYTSVSSGGGSSKASSPQGATSASTVQRAEAAIKGGRSGEAISLLKDFDRRFAGAKEVENAQFLLAEALVKDGQYAEGIAAYHEIIERYPESSRIPHAMLQLGVVLVELGEKEEARFFLTELTRIYPDTSEAKKASAQLKKLNRGK